MSKKKKQNQSKESLSKIKNEVADNLNISPDEANARLVSQQSGNLGTHIIKRLANGKIINN